MARRRPLLDAMTIRRGPRKGEVGARLSAERRRQLEMLGLERALVYKTLVLTGLRRGELASLTVGQLELDVPVGAVAYAMLNAADAKNRRGAEIPLRSDLAVDLQEWLALKLEAQQVAARESGGPIPVRLPPQTPVFNVPDGLVRILNRDLVLAGLARRREDGTIDKADDRGWTIDVHALRHSFGTLLSQGGVAPRTAQAAMRHGSLDLTMNTYTDPRLLDVAGALDVLPELPLDSDDRTERQRATGTTDDAARTLVPMLVPNAGNRSTSGANAGKTAESTPQGLPSVSDADNKPCASVTTCVEQRVIGLEPTTFTLAT